MKEDNEEDEPDDEDQIETPDSIIDKKHCALELEGNIEGLIPPELTLEVTVHYEDNFLAAYAGDHDEAVATIEATLTQPPHSLYILERRRECKQGKTVFKAILASDC